MKKIVFLFLSLALTFPFFGQDQSDLVRFSESEIQGSARYRAMSGAFGALGGDMSAVRINPAGSAIFKNSQVSFSVLNTYTKNDVTFFGNNTSSSEVAFDINQAGGVLVFKNNNKNSPWRQFSLGIAYDRFSNYRNDWTAVGTGDVSISNYFLGYANGLRLDEISALPGERFSDAYLDIGSTYGFGHQQAFLGYESFLINPDTDTDDNTSYGPYTGSTTFNQRYTKATRGYNGSLGFNFAAQYKDVFYFGVNLNSHYIHYEESTLFRETNSNTEAAIRVAEFSNNLLTTGRGFSFQLGAIAKITDEFRVGATITSPTWFSIDDELSQSLSTVTSFDESISIFPNSISVFPTYRFHTPGKLTGSLAYVFGEKGLISFDYAVKDNSTIKIRPASDPHFSLLNENIEELLGVSSTYRVGGEYRHKQFSFRGGFRVEESPYKDTSSYGDLVGYSLGLGYNFGSMILNASFDQAQRDIDQKLYKVDQMSQATVDTKNSNITLSLIFNF